MRRVPRLLRAPLNERAYWRGYSQNESVANDFTLDQIQEIIRTGDLNTVRQLSRYYYRTNSSYRNNIDFLAHLPLYDTVVVPVFSEDKGSEAQIIKTFNAACKFVEKMDLPNTLSRVTTQWLINGIYNGILRISDEGVILQDLPLYYCRTRFKDFHNLNILEFNLSYFDHFTDERDRIEALQTFPEVVRAAWKKWKNGKGEQWVAIPGAVGGVSFCFTEDQMPLLLSSIPELKKMDDATKREEKRDENELYKLLIQQMPVDKNGELIFELDEVAEIHASIAEMLENEDTVEVLTTFGDTSLESLQDSSAASQSSDRIAKYRTNAFGALGRGELLFNATNSTSLAATIKKDEALMIGYLNIYEAWIKYVLNQQFKRKGLTFDFNILPTTRFNQIDMQQAYFRGAQYGYSKMYAGVAMGINQSNIISLMTFENDYLKMSEKMVPLQSSYTTSGKVIANEEKNNSSVKSTTKTSQSDNIENTGGRPELPDDQKSEQTQANNESMQ